MKRATYIPMGAAPCSVGFCLDDKTYRAEMRVLEIKNFNPFVSPGADATVHEFQNTATMAVALLCIDAKQRAKHRRSVTSSAALIAHEAVHILQFVKREMRETEAGAEFEAYTVQWVTQEVLAAYLKVKRHG